MIETRAAARKLCLSARAQLCRSELLQETNSYGTDGALKCGALAPRPAWPRLAAADRPQRLAHLVEIERLADEAPRPDVAGAPIGVDRGRHHHQRNPRQ